MGNGTTTYEDLTREELILLAKGNRNAPHEDSLAAMLTASPREGRKIAAQAVHPGVWVVLGVFAMIVAIVFAFLISVAITT